MSHPDSTEAISIGIVTSGVPADPTMSRAAQELSRAHGGYWGQHPVFTVDEWQLSVAGGATRQGYWEWALARELEHLCSEVTTAEASDVQR